MLVGLVNRPMWQLSACMGRRLRSSSHSAGVPRWRARRQAQGAQFDDVLVVASAPSRLINQQPAASPPSMASVLVVAIPGPT